jgi:hypothetical protein
MLSELKRQSAKPGLLAFSAMLLVASLSGCQGSSTGNTAQNTETPTTRSSPEPTPKSAFERDLQYIRNGQFTHVWVFSRKDGHPLDKDDADYLRKNAPQVVDWVTTDNGKKVIAGSNFDLEEGNLNLLKKRFVVEDYTGR